MLSTHFKIILRSLQRNWIFTVINLGGLTLSLVAVILIALYVRHELSYDKYLPTSERLYRIYSENSFYKDEAPNIGVPGGLGEVLQDEFPEVSSFSTVNQIEGQLSYGDQQLNLKIFYASEKFFSLFPYQFIKGNPTAALTNPESIVLTESAALKLFGPVNPLNKFIKRRNGTEIKVTGVIKDIPANSHFKVEAICPSINKEPLSWRGYSSKPLYILLKRGADEAALEKKLPKIYAKYDFPEYISIHLLPVTDIHLKSHSSKEFSENSDIRYVYILTFVAILLLLVASINYVNLSTARSFRRAREVGVSKVMGATRRRLVLQFLSESLVFFVVSALIALVVSYIIFPAFASFLKMDVSFISLIDRYSASIYVLFIFIFGLLAGVYPAFYLSRQSPAFVIKGVVYSGTFSSALRKSLVVFQFAISVFLIMVTIVIFSQLRYIQDKNLGFDKEQLLILTNERTAAKGYAAFRNKLNGYSGIRSVSNSDWNPGMSYQGSASWSDEEGLVPDFSVNFIDVSSNFIPEMGIKISKGRNFSERVAADNEMTSPDPDMSGEQLRALTSSRSIILNETAVRELKLRDPVGKRLSYPALQGTVIGVIRDFNGLSLHQAVKPIALRMSYNSRYTFIKIKPGSIRNTLAFIEKEWKRSFPNDLIKISFVDEQLQKLYAAEERLGRLFSAFAILGVIIASLGLLGLVSFMTEQRTKEIGIRKVLGASIRTIAVMLSGDFLKPVVLASLIAFPAAWSAVSIWLQNFAYRVNIQWWMFLIAGSLAVFIALITVSFQALKAAFTNPVDSLRSE